MIFRGNLPNYWAEKIELFAFASLFSIARFPKFVISAFSNGDQHNLFIRFSLWILPLTCAGIFVLLFAEANPVWQQWLEAIDFAAFFNFIVSDRFLFAVALAWFSYPFIEQKMPRFLISRAIQQMRKVEKPQERTQENEKRSLFHTHQCQFRIF